MPPRPLLDRTTSTSSSPARCPVSCGWTEARSSRPSQARPSVSTGWEVLRPRLTSSVSSKSTELGPGTGLSRNRTFWHCVDEISVPRHPVLLWPLPEFTRQTWCLWKTLFFSLLDGSLIWNERQKLNSDFNPEPPVDKRPQWMSDTRNIQNGRHSLVSFQYLLIKRMLHDVSWAPRLVRQGSDLKWTQIWTVMGRSDMFLVQYHLQGEHSLKEGQNSSPSKVWK